MASNESGRAALKSIEIELEGVVPDLYDEETVALNREDLMAAAQLVRHASRPAPPAPPTARATNSAVSAAPWTDGDPGAPAPASAGGYGQLGEATSYGNQAYGNQAYGNQAYGNQAYGDASSHANPGGYGESAPYGHAASAYGDPNGAVHPGGYAGDPNGAAGGYAASPFGDPNGAAHPGGYAGDPNGAAHPGSYAGDPNGAAGGYAASPFGDPNGAAHPGGYAGEAGYGDGSGYGSAAGYGDGSGYGSAAGYGDGYGHAAPPAGAIQRVAAAPYAPASFGPGTSVPSAHAPVPQFNPASGLESATPDPFRKRWGLGSWLMVTVGFLSLAAVGLLAGVAATERGRAWLKELSGSSPASPAIAATAPFDPAAANRALERMEAQAGECLSQYQSSVKGRLSVRFGVDGKVKLVNLEGDVASLGELPCVRSAFEAAQVRPFTGQEAQVQKAVELAPPSR